MLIEIMPATRRTLLCFIAVLVEVYLRIVSEASKAANTNMGDTPKATQYQPGFESNARVKFNSRFSSNARMMQADLCNIT